MAQEKEQIEERPRADKRKSLRTHLLVLKVQGKYSNKSFFGYAKNISRSGLFISSFTPKEAGERFPLEFTLPDTDIMIRCTAEVIWARRFDPQMHLKANYEPGMGLKFLDLPEDKKKIIDEWVKKEK
ncbi:MAG: PilZ domain-containing protein [Nitrospirae bacterium]|nr:PilZ domain-containing protein [Nitrospirota bacterium]